MVVAQDTRSTKEDLSLLVMVCWWRNIQDQQKTFLAGYGVVAEQYTYDKQELIHTMNCQDPSLTR
ncbi:unnamed protein product [Absidia cylindrospora]